MSNVIITITSSRQVMPLFNCLEPLLLSYATNSAVSVSKLSIGLPLFQIAIITPLYWRVSFLITA